MSSSSVPGGVVTSYSSADGDKYTMVFTFADGRTQQMVFSVPAKSPKSAEGAEVK